MDVIAEDVVTEVGGQLRLVAGRCARTGRLVFPKPDGEGWTAEALPSEGTLWSFTVQGFAPKSPPFAGVSERDAFSPFGLGYVQLGDALIVQGRLSTYEGLRIGMPMRTAMLTFPTPDGEARVYGFAPVEEPS